MIAGAGEVAVVRGPEAVGIVHILVAGEAPEHRLAKLGDRAVATVPPGAGVGENLGRHRREAERIVEFPECEQAGIALAAIPATLWKLFIALVTRRFAFLSWVVSAARASRIGALSRCRLNARDTMSPIQTELAVNSTAQGLGDQPIGDVIALDCFGRAGLCGGLRAIMEDPLATASRGSRHHPALPPRSARMGTISLRSSLPSPPGRRPLRQASLL